MTARVLNDICFQNFVYICQLSAQGNRVGPSFSTLDALLTVLSIATFLSDIATDAIVVFHYSQSKLWVYAGLTLLFVVVPSIVVHLFSLRWHIHDKRNTKLVWIVNCLQLGVLHRYVRYLKTGLRADRTQNMEDFQDLYQQQSDLCMLRLFDSFLESAPQLVLQLYIMVSYENWNLWTGISAIASLLSLGWGIAAYGKAMRLYRSEKQHLSWTGAILQTLWRFGTMTSRVSAMVLFAVACGPWIFLVLVMHWIAMTVWVVLQETDFCPAVWEERVYNAVVGVIYTFCFFNIKEGPSRHRVVAFYGLIFIQNFAFLLAYSHAAAWDSEHVVPASGIIVGSFSVGMCCMALYYRFFHPSGPIALCRMKPIAERDAKVYMENGNGVTHHPAPRSPPTVGLSHSFRTLKYVDHRGRRGSSPTTPSPAKASSPIVNQARTNFAEHYESFLSSSRLLNCSLLETHRSHSQNCNLDNSVDDIIEHDVNVFKERTCSRYRVVNYNFRPSVSGAKLYASQLHCSCLILQPTIPDGDATTQSVVGNGNEKLQSIKSAPDVRTAKLAPKEVAKLENWSMCNYMETSANNNSEGSGRACTDALLHGSASDDDNSDVVIHPEHVITIVT